MEDRQSEAYKAKKRAWNKRYYARMKAEGGRDTEYHKKHNDYYRKDRDESDQMVDYFLQTSWIPSKTMRTD